MTQEEITTIHEYIKLHGLINHVEARTRRNWNTGSRTTYYSAKSHALDGIPRTATEILMLLEAQKLVQEHKMENESAMAAV